MFGYLWVKPGLCCFLCWLQCVCVSDPGSPRPDLAGPGYFAVFGRAPVQRWGEPVTLVLCSGSFGVFLGVVSSFVITVIRLSRVILLCISAGVVRTLGCAQRESRTPGSILLLCACDESKASVVIRSNCSHHLRCWGSLAVRCYHAFNRLSAETAIRS